MMNAAYITAVGPPSAIRVGELPLPVLGGGDVLVEVEAVAVNPVDTFVRSGAYRTPIPLPFVIGRDLVGTVRDVGSESLPFAPGDRVWCNSMGHAGRQGPSAEYCAVPADRLYRLPDGVDASTCVVVAHPAGTAYLGWFVHAGLRAGETVFVGGGAGNVGMAAIEMAALAGARVLASARSHDHERCLAAGAEAVFDYHDPELDALLADRARAGVDVIWETSGRHNFEVAARVAAPGCRILITAGGRPGDINVPLWSLYTRDVSLLGFVISLATAAQLADAAALVNEMLSAGRLTARIADRLPLRDAPVAHARMEAGAMRGRILLEVSTS